MDRETLVLQMAKAFAGEAVLDPEMPTEETQKRAAEALCRVERFLGVEVEEAREILTRVLEDVT